MKKKELSYKFLLLKHMPYSLLMFLINENLLHAFMQNVESKKLSDVINVMLETIIPGRFVFINAFLWISTPEGHDFWHKKYIEFCKLNVY